MKNRFNTVLLTLALLLPSLPALAMTWPQDITASEGTITVYQPQPESLEGNTLKSRAAFSIDLASGGDPIFGAMWFTARLDTDRDSDTAIIRDLVVDHVQWPDSKDAEEQRFTTVVEGAMPQAGFEISMERLTASLAAAETEAKSLQNLKNDPPKIVFRQDLAVLLPYDGKPRFSDIDNSPYERALNAPFAVIHKKRSDDYFLTSGDFWYAARDPLGPWTPDSNPPSDLVSMVPKPSGDDPKPASPPEIVTATEPTELVVTAGAPDWESLPNGQVLYVKNTETAWLRDLASGNMYLMLSGRWYRSKAEDGPWTFVPADELPAGFQDIPPASDIGGLRTSVAGTPEAEDAMRDQAIPQTAAIKRSDASLTVTYDGKPKFEKIKGTDVAYAVNTGAQVLEIDKRYYAVDNGVWYTSAEATGPWVVADSIPDDKIAEIPPSSPVYNTTYVHVYDSTPEVVYVGYTPGYMWSFPYYGVPVYGTGWYYPPYWGGAYYPRPPTWGFNVGYNPWTGWSFGLSWSNGFFNFGMSWGGGYPGPYRPWGCCGGWYGGGYHGGYHGGGNVIINTGDINIGNNINIGNRTNISNRIGNDTRLNNLSKQNNLYNRPENRARKADPAVVRRDLQNARPAQGKLNNVYADRSGAVTRPNGDQWQVREDGQWKDAADRVSPDTRDQVANAGQQARDRAAQATPEQRQQAQNSARQAQERATQAAQNRSAANRASGSYNLNTRDLNRDYSARQRGRSMERSRPMPRGGNFGGRRR
ncbi:carbohydrate-binding family V/XII [Marinihelvus fidelis]|uniref:Carbohydrate-binding family V/XII n=1 Tax=Marinihelvus fidelis TaxID=2613842 RepID=A0A5N0THG4_9GAMM|nr:carbohydrate-binding family V/XII [Marinihelvus fidelis]KAA9134021.1 carbohydrate-binding family V/XII [Marinihelvus fidelis]